MDSAEHKTMNDETILQKNGYASEVSRRQYLNKRTADVFFTFDNSNERVPAHKSVLAAASEVFDRMFYGPMAMSGDVSLPGKAPEAFKNLLQFCYLDEVVLKFDDITEVMSLLHEYQLMESLMLCGKFLVDNWTIEDICSMYDWAISLQMEEFQTFYERKICVHIAEIFKTDDFLSCSFNVLEHILNMDSLLCDESAILSACLDWARYKCKQNGKDGNDVDNLREFLIDKSKGRNLLWNIRYGSIAHAEFLAHLDAAGGLFEDATEYEDVIRLLLGSKNVKTGKFQTEPRKLCQLCWNEQAVECDLLAGPRIDRETFGSKQIVNVMTVDGLILLEGFYNAKMVAHYINYNLFVTEFSIKEQPINGLGETKLLYKNRLTFEDNQELYFQLKPNPIVLKPGFEYHCEFSFESSDIRYDRYEIRKKIKLNEHDSIYIRSQVSDNGPFIMKKLKLKSLN